MYIAILIFNNLSVDTCHFQRLSEENAARTEYDFNWDSVPTAIGVLT